MADVPTTILYIILGAIVGIIWSLRKMYVLENKIIALDSKTEKILEHLGKKTKK